MHSSSRFKVNSPQVTHETIDGEAVILNLDTGSYYSISSAGAVIWGLLDAGASIGRIVKTIATSYTGDSQEIETGVYALVEKLEQEGLIIANNGTGGSGTEEAETSAQQSEKPSRFEFPNLHKYTDMEDLLLLDPIHDVDDAGWPNKNQDEK